MLGSFDPPAKLGKSGILALVCQKFQHLGQHGSGAGVDRADLLCSGALEILERTRLRILVLHVDLAGGDTVAEHLGKEAYGHLHRLVSAGLGVVVPPVFEVVAVAPLVVHPCKGIAKRLPFRFVGAALAVLIVADAGEKFCGAVFGEIVPQPLPENAGFAAVPDDHVPMACDGAKMSPECVPAHELFLHSKNCSDIVLYNSIRRCGGKVKKLKIGLLEDDVTLILKMK